MPPQLAELIELGHTRFCAWVNGSLTKLQSQAAPTSFAEAVDALANHKRLEGEISRNRSQESDLQELRAGMLALGQEVKSLDVIIAKFHNLMNEVADAAKAKRQQLETLKKSLEKIEDAKQREVKNREKLLQTFNTSVTAAFELLGATSDLNEFPVTIWPYEQLYEYSKELPTLEESLTKYLTQVQRAELVLFDAKITEEVISCVSDNLKAELARFAQELRNQRKNVAAEIDRRSRSPISALGPSTTFAPYTPNSRDNSPTHADLKLVLTRPNEGDKETRFSFSQRPSVSVSSRFDRGSLSRSYVRNEDTDVKHRAFETMVKAAQETKVSALKSYAIAVCNAIPFFWDTADFPKKMPPSHPISKDPGPARLALTDSEKFIIRLLGCIQEIGTSSEKIFSAAGLEHDQAALDVLAKDPRKGLNVELSGYNVHSVAACLKRFLGVGESLIPSTLFEPLTAIDVTKGSKAREIKNCLAGLSPSKYYCLQKLFHVITTVCGNQNETKMDVRSLAHVFAPYLLKRGTPSSNMYQIMTDTKLVEGILAKMIEEAHLIFGEEARADVGLADAINFGQWPSERLFAFVDTLDTGDAKLTETGNQLWAELERAHAKLAPFKFEYLQSILASVELQRSEFLRGQTRRRDLCALEVQRRGQQEAQARNRGQRDPELELLYAKQRSALISWLSKVEEISTVTSKAALNAGELVAMAERDEIAAILVAATDSAIELQLKGSEWEALLDIKQQVDEVLSMLTKFT